MNGGLNEYNDYVKATGPQKQEEINGGQGLSRGELEFISKYAKSSVLDIGCSTANRTFPTYTARKLKATGIEKFEHLIHASNYKNQIVQLDLGDPEFLKDACFTDHYDLAVCFRGVINGFIDEQLRQQAWKNLAGLLLSSCVDYLLVDTYPNVPWYNTSEIGQCFDVHPSAPPQYMYSRQELIALFNHHKLEVVEETMAHYVNTTLAYFLLKVQK